MSELRRCVVRCFSMAETRSRRGPCFGLSTVHLKGFQSEIQYAFMVGRTTRRRCIQSLTPPFGPRVGKREQIASMSRDDPVQQLVVAL